MPSTKSFKTSLFFLPFLLAACLIGCKQEEPTPDPIPNPVYTPPLNYLALGDSYTIGEGVSENARWPNQLTDSLNARGISMNYPLYVARTGWTTDELQRGIEDENPSNNYDLVSLLVGVNNQFRGYSFLQYEEQFLELLQSAIGFTGMEEEKVFVVSIPDYGVTPFALNMDTARIADEIDQYNAYAKQICDSLGVAFFDITPISRQADDIPSLIASDGLHPSELMYAQWVELMVEEVAGKVE